MPGTKRRDDMDAERAQQEVLIVTGMSGAGRSTVADALEDVGWFVVDNLPPQMMRMLVDLAERVGEALPRIAVVVDVRGRDLFRDLQGVLDDLRDGAHVRMVFLEATDESLVRRFESVRRPHPLQGDGTILEGIELERERLGELRAMADLVVDTSALNIHQLASTIHQYFKEDGSANLLVTVMSFGFKYGLPTDADLVADARFLPNPYWVPELRDSTGLDETVSEYVLSRNGAVEFIDSYAAALAPVFVGYQNENKRHATVALGCTGGKHRSVAMSVELASRLAALPGVAVTVRHRDLGRE